jgi:hypothetical protein
MPWILLPSSPLKKFHKFKPFENLAKDLTCTVSPSLRYFTIVMGNKLRKRKTVVHEAEPMVHDTGTPSTVSTTVSASSSFVGCNRPASAVSGGVASGVGDPTPRYTDNILVLADLLSWDPPWELCR